MSRIVYVNGRYVPYAQAAVHVEDRGFQFADAIYEVFKFLRGRPVFLPDHFRRLDRGLRDIDIRNPWTESTFASTVRELLRRTAFDEGIVYIQVSRGEGERAHFYPDDMKPTVIAYSRRFEFPDAAKKERGIRLITTGDQRWQQCRVKSVNLLANALAKKRAQRAGADEALLLASGFVREGASSNFFAVRNGRLVTPPLDEHILAGIVRAHAIGLALGAKIPVDELPLREAELFHLDEAFITSTTQGIMPVTELDGRIIGNSHRGEITAQLQRLFDEEERRDAGG